MIVKSYKYYNNDDTNVIKAKGDTRAIGDDTNVIKAKGDTKTTGSSIALGERQKVGLSICRFGSLLNQTIQNQIELN